MGNDGRGGNSIEDAVCESERREKKVEGKRTIEEEGTKSNRVAR